MPVLKYFGFNFAVFFCALSFAHAEGEKSWTKPKLSLRKSILHLSGKVVPQDGALTIISAHVAGRIVGFLKREGDDIKNGTPIYRISSAECHSLAEEKRVASQKKMPDLLEAVGRRETQLGLLLDGSECKVISNFAGTIVKRNMEMGASFNPGDPLATVVDTRRLTVELEVPEGELAKVSRQNVVKVKVSNTSSPVIGKVDTIVPTIDSTTRTGKIRLKNLSLPRVSIESLVTADLESVDGDQKAWTVPKTSLVFFKNKHYVLKKTAQSLEIVTVHILNEDGKDSMIQAEPPTALNETDDILQEGAIFQFKKINQEKLK